MKKNNFRFVYLFTLCCLLLFSCGTSDSKTDSGDSTDTNSGFNFSASAGVKLDINTGTKTSYPGFSVDEIYIVDAGRTTWKQRDSFG